MARIEQSAGACTIVVYTDGSPFWPEITLTSVSGQKVTAMVDVASLHDIRYCISRVLDQLAEAAPR